MENTEGQPRRSPRLKAQENAANFPYELLLHILSLVSLVDRLANVAAVCSSWRAAASDLSLAPRKLDLIEWSRQLSHLSLARERAVLSRAFVRGINICVGRLNSLAFGPRFRLKARHLLHASSRCPNLQELVLPGLYRNWTEEQLTTIFRQWPRLESVTLGPEHQRHNIFEILGRNCPSLKVLDICCLTFFRFMAADILSWMPRLKVMRIYCEFDSVELEFATYRLFGLPELREITVTVNNQPARHYTRSSSSQPWDF